MIGEGATQEAGGPHAEVVAIHQAKTAGHRTEGSTAYVTLEPCSHHGRTPPCCDALVAAGIAQVYIATLDPNPLVAGEGVARLRAAGIGVTVSPLASLEAQGVREMNIGFFSRMIRKRPWVRLKLAASMDGKTALTNGESQWITSQESRADGHAWRARACRVLTGVGTVLADDPMLDVREVPTARQPQLVVVDSHLRTPPGARLFQNPPQGNGRTVTVVHGSKVDDANVNALQAAGAHLCKMPSSTGRIDLNALMNWLAAEGETNELHVEAGPTLGGAMLSADLVDELLLYQAPVLLGPGLPLLNLPTLTHLEDAKRMEMVDTRNIGPDLRVLARLPERDRFLQA